MFFSKGMISSSFRYIQADPEAQSDIWTEYSFKYSDYTAPFFLFYNIHTCGHKINAVLHCLINCNASLFPCFAVALCCKFTRVCEGGSVEAIGNSHTVVLRRCASCKSGVAGRSAEGPL